MANEFYYCVSLSIVHPTIDPKSITEVITVLHPRIERMVGSQRQNARLKSELSHWLADLHNENRLYSGDWPMSDFLLGQLDKLMPYQYLFAQLREEGRVLFRIGWFSESNCSAELLDAEVLRKCGHLGIDLELNFYGPSTT